MDLSKFVIPFILTLSFLSISKQENIVGFEDLSLVYMKWKYKYDPDWTDMDHTDTGNASDVFNGCDAFINEYAKQASHFIKCSIANARPFKFCEKCVVHYQKAKTVYSDIKLNDVKKNNCQKLLLNSDRVQVISNVYRDIENIWTSSDCGKCFDSISEDINGTVRYTLRQTTLTFLDLYRNFTHCVPQNTTKLQYNQTICKDCAPYYDKMNKMFDKLLDDKISPHHVCMDIVDMMNYTRLMWGDTLKCTKFQKDYAPIILIAIGFLSLPPIFYICMKVYGTRKEKEIIRQKRLSIYNQDNSFSVTVTNSPQQTEQNHVPHVDTGHTNNSSPGPTRKRQNPGHHSEKSDIES